MIGTDSEPSAIKIMMKMFNGHYNSKTFSSCNTIFSFWTTEGFAKIAYNFFTTFRCAFTEPSTTGSPVLLSVWILPAVREEYCETFQGSVKFRIVRNVQSN